MKISFSPPYVDDDVINEVVDTLQSGWITTGPKVKALEEEIKKKSKAQEVLCVNSWTSGAIMMLRWLGLKEDDEVIVPAYTYCATAFAVLHAGAKLILVDVDEDFNISVDAIKRAITPKTKAIIPVDFAGYPCDYDKIMDLVKSDEIKKQYIAENKIQEKIGRIMVINDAAHSIGAIYKKDMPTGSETDVVIFSLHAVKNITTAEGGAICLNLPKPFDNSILYKQLRQMALNCQTKDALSKSKAGGWKYDIVGFGMKINMADVNAAIGLAQIRKYSDLLRKRREIFELYNKGFSQYNWAILPPSNEDERVSSCQIYPLRIRNISEEIRDKIIEEISTYDVAVNVHFIPIPLLTYFKNLDFDIKHFPNSYDNYKCEISLPIYPQLTESEVDYVIESVVKSIEKYL